MYQLVGGARVQRAIISIFLNISSRKAEHFFVSYPKSGISYGKTNKKWRGVWVGWVTLGLRLEGLFVKRLSTFRRRI